MLTNLFVRLQNWKADDEGATAVEYGIMVALIAAVIIVTVGLIGEQLLAAFNKVLTELGYVAPPA